MPKKVFVCYDHSEDNHIKNIINTWNGEFEFVFDKRPLNIDFQCADADAEKQAIEELMEKAEYLLVIVGQKAHESRWMTWEIELAKQRNLKLKLAALRLSSDFTTPAGLSGTGVSFTDVFSEEGVAAALKEASNVDFNSLYDIYSAGHLVLIVGSDVLRMKESQKGKRQKTFEQEAIEQIIGEPCPFNATFGEVAIRYSNAKITSSGLIGIYTRYCNTPSTQFDDSLVQLIAELPKVNLFIQTSFDTALKQKLGKNVETFVWNHKANQPIHLNNINGKQKLVYLFGNTEEGIAVLEEEQIDCLLNLSMLNEVNKSKKQENYSLLEYLKDKTLVFIGNNFPDWFMRLLLRTLYNGPITEQVDKAYIVNENSREILFKQYFYDKFRIELIHDYPIRQFLQSFHRIIDERDPLDNWHQPKRVFISYDRTDSIQAKELKKCLNRRHIDAFLDTDDMAIAEHQRKIMELIQDPKTCLFICLLSRILIEKKEKDSYVKRIEWKVASSRYVLNGIMRNKDGENSFPPFIVVPVALDDFKNYNEVLPDFIIDNNVIPFIPIEELCNLIEEEIKNINYEY